MTKELFCARGKQELPADKVSSVESSGPKVTIIIAAFNATLHIARAVRSCLGQTYRRLEIIVVDDGSQDDTATIVEKLAASDDRIRLIRQANAGQGAARNIALDKATGSYVTILDADDELKERGIEYLVAQALSQNADIVIGEMIECFLDGRVLYRPIFDGWKIDQLKIKDIRVILRKTYFSVGRLYRKDMLDISGVRYGEAYIYEDIEFVLGSFLHARIVSAIPHPVYKLNITEGSTTRSRHATDWHSNSFVKAIESCVTKYGSDMAHLGNSFVTYVLSRTVHYILVGRVGKRYARRFCNDVMRELRSLRRNYFVQIGNLNSRAIKISSVTSTGAFLYLLAARKLISLAKNKKVSYIIDKAFLPLNLYLARYRAATAKKKKAILRKKALSSGFVDNMVLFHGFDGHIRGNTKYVLSEFVVRGFNCYVVSNNEIDAVPGAKMIKMWSEDFHYACARARFHILETWGHLAIGKQPGAIWIQMWHGTPLKQLLLDSPEKDIKKSNPKHVLHKLRDISRWDYLIAQSEFCKEALSKAFAFERCRIVTIGYPRMNALLPKGIDSHRIAIREKYSIKPDKKLVLYAETWRDYNYKTAKKDFAYQVDWSAMPKEFFEENTVLYVGHPFSPGRTPHGVTMASGDDFQHLLAAADALVTDYSSALFDYLSLGRPFCLFMRDLEKYMSSRGLYAKPLADFEEFIARDEVRLAEILSNPPRMVDKDVLRPYLDASKNGGAAEQLAVFVLSLKTETSRPKDIFN